MSIIRINQLPSGSGNLTNDDIFPFMDDPSGSGITKQISLSQIAAAIGTSSSSEASSLVTNVFNKTGSPIPKMTAVYISGGQGDQPTISLAQASGESASSKTYGLTAETINDMSAGKVIVFGALTGLNTDQFNPTAPTGDVNGVTLYLSPTTPGGLTTTKPSAPNHMVAIGTIIRTHQNEGVIEVRVQNGFELEELHNVAVSGVSNGQFLQYNSGSGLWLASSSGNFSSLTVNNTGVSVVGHTHTSANITDFVESVQDTIGLNGFLVSGTGININYNDSLNTLTVSTTGLQPSGNYSLVGHTHTSSDITNFNSAVSGLLPSLLPTVVQLGSVSGTINTNASLGDIFDLTLSASGTLANPSGGVDGQSLRWRITYNNNSIPLTLGSNFKIPSSASSPLPFSSTSGSMDILGATYDSSRNKWDVIAFVPGY
jgi:hypothetical protein